MLELLKLLGAERYTFQTFDDSPEKRSLLARTIHGKYDEHKETLQALNEKGAGIFVTINETDGRGRKENNIKKARAVWIDDDGKGVTMPNLPPTITVETSPDKYHYYWIFTEPTDNWDQWHKLQDTMVTKFGSDPSVRDRARVLRLPGFYHKKDKDQPFRVSEKISGNKYSFSILCKEFGFSNIDPQGGETEDISTPSTSQLDKAIEAILTGENFNNSLDTLSMHFANKGYSAYFIHSLLGGLISNTSCTDQDRIKARTAHLPTYVRTAKAKAREPKFKKVENSEHAGVKVTDIPMPPGMLGRIAENVLDFMRFPNKEMAILSALHVVSVFAGRRYTFHGKGLTAKRILLAPQGAGKNTINKYIQACVYGLQMPAEGSDLPRLVDAHKYLISGDFTAVRPVHQELEEFATRSMILSEAGQVGKSESGDKSGLKAYMLQLLSRDTREFILPKNYSIKKGDGALKPVYNPCAVILHESVPENYSEVIRDGGEFSDGSMARSDLIYVDFKRGEVEKNLGHSSAIVYPDIINFLADLAQRSLRDIPQEGTVPISDAQMIHAQWADKRVQERAEELDDLSNKYHDEAQSSIEKSLYVRKMERFYVTSLILAIADDYSSPRVTMEHMEWVEAYQEAIERTVKSLAAGGTFSDMMEQGLQAIREKITQNIHNPSKTFLRAAVGTDIVELQRKQILPRKFIADSLSHHVAIKKYAEATAKGNKRTAYNQLLSEMISLGELRMLSKDDCAHLGVSGDWYQYLYQVEL